MIDFARFHFLDASALVKLLLYPDVKEEGSDRLEDYRRNHSNFGTIELCVTETLSAIKSKHFGGVRSLNIDGYLIVVNRLRAMLKHKKLKICDFDFLMEEYFTEACHLVKKYNIDLIDAFQILTVKSGPFRSLENKSQTLLITADEDLSKAGRKEGLKIWYLIDEDEPPAD